MKKVMPLLLIAVFLSSAYLISLKPTLAQSTFENSWTTKAPLPQALAWGKAAVVKGEIYYLSGSHNYAYDPAADSWSTKAPMPTPRISFGIAEYQNKIYVIGGTNSDGTFASVNEVYDPSNDTWTTLAPLPAPRSGIDANAINGKIYVMGGANYTGYINYLQAFPQTEIYNIADNSWSYGKSMPVPVFLYTSAVLNNKIYFLGGAIHVDPTNLTQIYDPQKDLWTFGSNFSIPLMEATAVATNGIYAPQRIYLFGGYSSEIGDHDFGDNKTQVYDPASNTWINGTVMPTSRSDLAVTVVNDLIYVIGGNPTFISPTDVNEQYTPFGYGSTPLPTSTPTLSPTDSPNQAQTAQSQALPLTAIPIIAITIIAASIVIFFNYFKKQKKVKSLKNSEFNTFRRQ